MMKQTTPTSSDPSGGGTKNEAIRQFSMYGQDNRGQNVDSSSSSDVHRSSSSFASGSPWSRWIFNRSNAGDNRRLSISDVVPNTEKLYSVLSNCSSPTESEKSRPSIDASDESPVSLFHPSWIYENVPPAPILPAPAVPDILEASLGYGSANSEPILKNISDSSGDQRLLFPQRKIDCLPHCACRNMAASTSIIDSRSPLDEDLKKDSRLGFVDRARMVSFKRKKVAPTVSTISDPTMDGGGGGAICAQCTCFLDPVNLSLDAPQNSTFCNTGTLPCPGGRADYENTKDVVKTVILHTGFTLPPTGGQDLMLAMDSPRLKKANEEPEVVPKVQLANGEGHKRNKLNLTIDTGMNGENGHNFYDPIYEFLMSSPVMRKLKELGFQYPAFPSDVCNKEGKRLRVLYVVIALLLLTVLALILLNVFVPKMMGTRPVNQLPNSANISTVYAEPTTLSSPVFSEGQNFDVNIKRPVDWSTTLATIKAVTPETAAPPTSAAAISSSTSATTEATSEASKTQENATKFATFPLPGHAVFPNIDTGSTENATTISTSTKGSTRSIKGMNTTLASTTSVTSLFPVSYPADIKCPEDQFKCRSGVSRMPCLYQWERCDGIADCSDGSDEEACDTIRCFGNFQCGDKSCVALAKVCNGIFDCPDGSDELKCDKFKCQSYEYRCPSGYCIPKEWVCDGEADCPGHFDEQNCSTCAPTHFRCPEGWCIPSSWKCNGIRDCAAGQDEENCACAKPDQLRCASGGARCVDKERLCDGVPDCPDSSDEWNCVLLQGDALAIRDQISDEMLPICSQEWSAQDADLTCRQLGYEKAEKFWEVPFQSENRTDLFIRSALSQPTTFNFGDRLQFLVKKRPAAECATRKVIALSCQKFDCGHWPGDPADPAENRVRRMVGGKTSKEHEWPSVAVLYHPQKKWACTASVIAPSWLITSALCVRRTDASPVDWKVVAGNADPSETDPDRQISRSILRFVQHPSYKLILTLLADFDVMLVQLSSPLPLAAPSTVAPGAPVVSPICMPERPTPPGTRCVTAGWGYTNPGGYFINKRLKHLPVGVWPKEVCNSTAHYPGLLSERNLCASNDKGDWGPCFNDEGAPLMCQYPGQPDRWYLAGVLTAQSCGSAVKHPAVYADVYSLRNWINGVVGKPVVT